MGHQILSCAEDAVAKPVREEGSAGPPQPLRVAPVTATRFRDMEALFQRPGPRGGVPMPGSCWCMWWRQRSGDASANKAGMRRLVESGDTPGLLAYRGGDPVGWVSVAPREQFGALLRSRQYKPTHDEQGVWAITCFYVDPAAKGEGVGRALAAAAVEHASARGASAVEAYPLDRPDFMGSAALFRSLGFRPVRDAGRRTVMRIEVDRPH